MDLRHSAGPADCSDEPTSLGKGETELLNACGYMCCLGQFSKQCGVFELHLEGEAEPSPLWQPIGWMFDENPAFVGEAIHINDALSTTVKEKIDKLKALCKLHQRIQWMDAVRPGSRVFSARAISINDDEITPVDEKIAKLKELCKEYGIKLIVKNWKGDKVVNKQRTVKTAKAKATGA